MANRPFNPESIAPPQGLYVHGMEVPADARTIHVSGQVGVDAEGNLPADFCGQAVNVWDNLMAVLADAGLGMGDVVKVTHFLTRREDLAEYGEVRKGYMGDHRPCSTVLVVAGLASPDFLLEVEMVASAG